MSANARLFDQRSARLSVVIGVVVMLLGAARVAANDDRGRSWGSICAFEDAAHCQTDSSGFIFRADRSIGSRRIDDFIGGPGGIARVCAWVCYTGDTQECSGDLPDDAWHIRIWDTLNGLPGSEIGYWEVNEPDSSGPVQPGQTRCWRATWPLDPPLTDGQDYDQGDCLWLELTGYGEGSQCRVFWQESMEGNRSSIEDRYAPLVGSPADHTPTTGMAYTDFQTQDLAFCIDSGISPATVPGVSNDGGCGDLPAACCYLDAGTGQSECVDGVSETISTCQARGGSWFPTIDCAFVFANAGGCPVPPNDLCENAINLNEVGGICDQDGAGAQVNNPDLRRCEGSGTSNYPVEGCFADTEPCFFGHRCLPWPKDGYYCEVPVDNVLAQTDGDPAGGTPPDDPRQACNSGANAMQADIWYRYTVPCTGEMSIRTCDDPNFDMMMSVYRYDPTECGPGSAPTGNTNLLACDDDFCPGRSAGASVVMIEAFGGDELLIRIAGWSASGSPSDAGQGITELEITVFCSQWTCEMGAPGPPGDVQSVDTHRYVSFAPNSGPTPVAFRVDLPDGRTGWVGEPELKSDRGADPQWVALVVSSTTDDGADQIRDWSAYTDPMTGYNVVYVHGCVIAPNQTYTIRAVTADFVSECPETFTTTPYPTGAGSWADCVGSFDPGSGRWGPPDGVTNFNDIAAVLHGFMLRGTAPVRQLDLAPQWSSYTINFIDVSMAIQGFQEVSYPPSAWAYQTIADCPLGGDPNT